MSECKRSSTCRCPDCAAAMSAFTVADLKAVSGITDDHAAGPVQRDPLPAKQTAVAAQTAPASPITPITELSAELTAADKLDTMAEEQEGDESSILRGTTFDDNSAILAAPDTPNSSALGTPRKQLGSGPIFSPSLDEFHDSFSDEQAVAARERAATPADAAAAATEQHSTDAMDMTLRQDDDDDAGIESVPATAALIAADADEALQEPVLPEPTRAVTAVSAAAAAAAAAEDAGKAAPGGRRRRRVSAGLGMVDQYASSDSTPKYSQGELDAAVSARIAELTAAHEKAAADSAQQHSAEAAALREELQTASQKIAALARAQQDKACDEELMATFEAKVEWYEKQKTEQDAALSSKTLQLELVTQNFSSLRADFKEQSVAHEAALAAAAAATAAVEAKLASSSAALEQLQSQYTSLAEVEREKRGAAVLKMKNDMRALATEQFAAAATQHRALQQPDCEVFASRQSDSSRACASLDKRAM
eukprot:17058-Heterococcus_DN1.PRE.2